VSLATWREATLASLLVPDTGWHYDDPVLLEKLATSLRRHGQLRALVVRTGLDGACEVVDGRRLLQAMLALGWERCWVADIGVVDRYASQQLALDLELHFDVDYVKLALAVAGLLERIGHFATLAVFDWKQFSDAPEGQGALDWSALEAPAADVPEPPAVPWSRRESALVPLPTVPLPADVPHKMPTLPVPALPEFPFPAAVSSGAPPDPPDARVRKEPRVRPQPQLALF
jgi:hypothetical protein